MHSQTKTLEDIRALHRNFSGAQQATIDTRLAQLRRFWERLLRFGRRRAHRARELRTVNEAGRV